MKMSEVAVAGPTSPVETLPTQVDHLEQAPMTTTEEQENQPESAKNQQAEEAVEPEEASKPESPATVTPESSPSSPSSLNAAAAAAASNGGPPPAMVTAGEPRTPVHEFITANRGRVVSLDRGHELRRVVSLDRGRELLSEMDGMNSSSDLSNEAEAALGGSRGSNVHSSSNDEYDDEDSLGSNSSDGESSYFAKHLPSPKSGRRWSYSDAASTSSAPARAGLYARNQYFDRESDASLSFSDDDDDDQLRPGMKIITSRSPMLPPPVPRDGTEEIPPYQHRITRIHSVSSLVSSSTGSDDGKARPLSRNGSHGSLSSSDGSANTSSSDPSVRSELRHVAVPNTQPAASPGNAMSSGRMAPPHYPAAFTFGGFQHTPVPQGSPPTIFNGHAPSPSAQDVAHPQPMTTDQMRSWLAAGSTGPSPFMPNFPGYGAMGNPQGIQPPPFAKTPSDAVNSSGNSADSANLTLTMVYSEDDETDDGKEMAGNEGGYNQGNRGGQFNSTMDRGLNPVNNDLLGMYGQGYNNSAVQQQQKMQVGTQEREAGDGGGGKDDGAASPSEKGYTVYWRRWLMLMYMSVLNLLSDWTCYSVAPISVLTSEAFGKINPEQLVVVFLGANAVATACEPIILSRLGLRRTIVFGSFLLMAGSIVKSGGIPPIIEANLTKGQGEWRVYLGFFLVGLSQPLYQCTPALLSASWFPESERTMATGVALNANQLGIGFAFIFGTLLVADSDDIAPYFGLLSLISTITFLGSLLQFDDAPPTPPSDTARVIRGTLEWNLPPAVDNIWKSVRSLAAVDDRSERERSDSNHSGSRASQMSSDQKSSGKQLSGETAAKRRSSKEYGRSRRKSRRSSSASNKSASSQSPRPSSRKQAQTARQNGGGATESSARRRSNAAQRNVSATSESGLRAAPGFAPPPSPAPTTESTHLALDTAAFEREAYLNSVIAPSRMMPGPVGGPPSNRPEEEGPFYGEADDSSEAHSQHRQQPPVANEPLDSHGYPQTGQFGMNVPMGYQYGQWQQPYWDPQYQQQQQQVPPYQQPPAYQQHPGYYPPPQQGFHPPQGYYYYPQGYYYPQMYPPFNPNEYQQGNLPVDEGAEPVVTVSEHHLDIDIRDDQIILSARACLSRPGFVHALVAFTVSGIVINTLSTFMDYLVRLNGAGREYVGIVGGSFQFVIMISSLIIGKQTDRTRAYYSVIIAMLVLGAFALAECGVSLDADRGSDLRWTLIIVAALVGPLQPVSTELGVDVAYPLSENTVLVIQQLFSNLLSAMFIPFFKALKDVGTEEIEDETELVERPEYTFSFYLLIVLHASATVFFATFNGRYLRYEQETAKKAQEEAKKMFGSQTAFHPVHAYDEHGATAEYPNERQPLTSNVV